MEFEAGKKYPYLERFSAREQLKAKQSFEYKHLGGRRLKDAKKTLENFLRGKYRLSHISKEHERYYVDCFKKEVKRFEKENPDVHVSHCYMMYYKELGDTLDVYTLPYEIMKKEIINGELTYISMHPYLERGEYKVDESFSDTTNAAATIDEIYSELRFKAGR